MRKFLFASHGYLAQGIKNSLELILGEQSTVDILNAYVQESFNLKECIREKLDALNPKDELIVVTDLFGGSVNNEFMVSTAGKEKIYLIAGLNLALCISLIMRKDAVEPTETIIEECLNEAKESMVYCSKTAQENENSEDDEF